MTTGKLPRQQRRRVFYHRHLFTNKLGRLREQNSSHGHPHGRSGASGTVDDVKGGARAPALPLRGLRGELWRSSWAHPKNNSPFLRGRRRQRVQIIRSAFKRRPPKSIKRVIKWNNQTLHGPKVHARWLRTPPPRDVVCPRCIPPPPCRGASPPQTTPRGLGSAEETEARASKPTDLTERARGSFALTASR